jgi:hypothetical protein
MRIDLSTVILVVRNGGCASYAKAQAAHEAGYKYLASFTTSDMTERRQAFDTISPFIDYDIAPSESLLPDKLIYSYFWLA